MNPDFGITRIDWQDAQAVAKYYGYICDSTFEKSLGEAQKKCPKYATVSFGLIIIGRMLAGQCPPLTRVDNSGSNNSYRPLGSNI